MIAVMTVITTTIELPLLLLLWLPLLLLLEPLLLQTLAPSCAAPAPKPFFATGLQRHARTAVRGLGPKPRAVLTMPAASNEDDHVVALWLLLALGEAFRI